ncbi:hypothetical protein ABKN59_007794 [Abortiporus biennis]
MQSPNWHSNRSLVDDLKGVWIQSARLVQSLDTRNDLQYRVLSNSHSEAYACLEHIAKISFWWDTEIISKYKSDNTTSEIKHTSSDDQVGRFLDGIQKNLFSLCRIAIPNPPQTLIKATLVVASLRDKMWCICDHDSFPIQISNVKSRVLESHEIQRMGASTRTMIEKSLDRILKESAKLGQPRFAYPTYMLSKCFMLYDQQMNQCRGRRFPGDISSLSPKEIGRLMATFTILQSKKQTVVHPSSAFILTKSMVNVEQFYHEDEASVFYHTLLCVLQLLRIARFKKYGVLRGAEAPDVQQLVECADYFTENRCLDWRECITSDQWTCSEGEFDVLEPSSWST